METLTPVLSHNAVFSVVQMYSAALADYDRALKLANEQIRLLKSQVELMQQTRAQTAEDPK